MANVDKIKDGAGNEYPIVDATAVHPSDLAKVATTGSYSDLTGKPTIPPAITVDSAMSSTSTNPVQNKVVNEALANLTDIPWKGFVSGINFNNYKSLGMYGVGGGTCVNSPLQSTWGTLYVLHGYGHGNLKFQLFIGAITGGNSMFIRKVDGSSWSDWTAVLTLQGGAQDPSTYLMPGAPGFIYLCSGNNKFYIAYGKTMETWKEMFSSSSSIPDTNIASASTWNGKQDALSFTTPAEITEILGGLE